VQARIAVERANHMIWVQNLYVAWCLDLTGLDFAFAGRFQDHPLRRFRHHVDSNLFQVEHNRRDILANTWN